MRFKYVKTSNHRLFMAMVDAVEQGAAKGARGVLVVKSRRGKPVGRSTAGPSAPPSI